MKSDRYAKERNQMLYEHEDEFGNTEEWIVEYVFIPGRPGRISGPPEHCYPEEPAEWEIVGISGEDGREIYADDLTETEYSSLIKAAQEYRSEEIPWD